MITLRDIKNGARVQGVVSSQTVEIVAVDWMGDQAINVIYRLLSGTVGETTLYRDDEHRLSVELGGRT